MEKPLRKRLPRDLNIKIILELPYSEAKKKCIFFNVCEDENLWRQYVKYNYFIEKKSDKLSWTQVAEMANEILESMFEKNNYPTFRVLPFLFEYFIKGENEIQEILGQIRDNFYNNGFVDINSFSDLYYGKPADKVADKFGENLFPNLPETSNESDISVGRHNDPNPKRHYTEFEWKCATYITDIITKPINYLAREGLVEIEFDSDSHGAILMVERPNVMSAFLENLQGQFYDYATIMFIKNFKE
jgi:hypothetical protein